MIKMTQKMHKKSIKMAIRMFCDLGGYQMEHNLGLRRHSQHRLVFSGIDLLKLQSEILELPDRALEAASQYGHNEPYNRTDLDVALTILSAKIGKI